MLHRFWLNHNYKLWWVIVVSVLVGYPMAVMHLNPPPAEANTEVVHGKILRVHRDQPHIRLELLDGRTESFNFPDDLLHLATRKGLLFTEATDYELKQLHGCLAELKVERIRYLVLPSDRRIWSVRCDKGITLPYSRIVSHYQSAISLTAGRWVMFGGMALLLLASAIGDRRVARERQQRVGNSGARVP
jgi:hypothetical protein